MSNDTFIEEKNSAADLSDLLFDVPVLSSQALTWTSILVEQRQHFVRELIAPPLEEHFLTFHLGQPVRLLQKRDGRTHKDIVAPGDITFMPAGQPSLWYEDVPSETMYLYLEPAFIQKVAAENDLPVDRIELINNFGTRDPQIKNIALMLQSEMRSGGLCGQLYVESLTNILAIHLLRHYSAQAPILQTHTGGLSKQKLQQAIEYIHEHLAEVSLAAIASEVGMSQYHFSRLFKQSTGSTPHQYTIQCRLEAAKRLLAAPELSINEISERLGFASHSQFTAFFRKYASTTPKAYRQEQ